MREVAKLSDGRTVWRCEVTDDGNPNRLKFVFLHKPDERREVFGKDEHRQLKRWARQMKDSSVPLTREDEYWHKSTIYHHPVKISIDPASKIRVWSMLRRCNGME